MNIFNQTGVFTINGINTYELERRIGYLQHILGNLETHMLKEQSERVDVKEKLVYLHTLQKQVDLEKQIESARKEELTSSLDSERQEELIM